MPGSPLKPNEDDELEAKEEGEEDGVLPLLRAARKSSTLGGVLLGVDKAEGSSCCGARCGNLTSCDCSLAA